MYSYYILYGTKVEEICFVTNLRCVYFCCSITLIRFQDILVLCHTHDGVSEALTDLYV